MVSNVVFWCEFFKFLKIITQKCFELRFKQNWISKKVELHFKHPIQSVYGETKKIYKNATNIHLPKRCLPKKQNILLDPKLPMHCKWNLLKSKIPKDFSLFLICFIFDSCLFVFSSFMFVKQFKKFLLWPY